MPGPDASPAAVVHAVVLTTPLFAEVPSAEAGRLAAAGGAPAVVPVVRPIRPVTGPILVPRRPPVPRNQVSGPLSPAAAVSDDVLFEDAQNAQLKFYLPRYRVAEQAVSGKAQFRARLEQAAQGGTLTIFLEKFPAPALAAAARDAGEIVHRIAVTLKARVPVGTSQIQQDLAFQEITFDGPLVKAVLRLDGLAQVTQVFQVLTDTAFAAALVVSRSFRVAVPVAPDAIPAVQQLAATIQGLNRELTTLNANLATLDRQRLQLQRLVATRPELRPRLAALDAQRAQVARQAALKRAELNARNAELAALRRQPHYSISAPVSECAVPPQPFVFPKDLHGYIFAGITPGTGPTATVSVQQVHYKERSHTYYQQTLKPNRFYFLPDAFKVKRRRETPHYPMLTVRFPNPDAPPETMPVTLEYVAGPVTDRERLEAAAVELKRHLPDVSADDPVEFEPLLSDTARLFMTLPRGDSGPQVEERTGATVDLRSGIVDAVTLPIKDFQGVFDALFGASAVVFQGKAVVDLDGSGAIPAEQIPVVARLDDLDGELIDIETVANAITGGVEATLRNAIESPLELHGLRARLARGDSTVEGVVSGLSFTPPLAIAPGASVSCAVVPVAPLEGAGEVSALFDLDRARVRPDAQAVWNAIVDASRLPEFTRTIRVKTIRQTFDANTGGPSAQVVVAVVDFERGDSVELSAEHIEAEAKVGQPVEDIILRRLQTGAYRYRLTVIRADGTQARDADWRSDTTGILFPQIQTGPAPV